MIRWKAPATFPQFTGDELTAYQAISAQLMDGAAGADLRVHVPLRPIRRRLTTFVWEKTGITLE